MTSKLHVTGDVKFVKVSDRKRDGKGKKSYKMSIHLTDKTKVYLYLNQYDLRKIKVALEIWWGEHLNDTN